MALTGGCACGRDGAEIDVEVLPERRQAIDLVVRREVTEYSEEDPIYFMDAVHPQHNPVMACGWIKRGEEREIPSNTGRKRININGAINLDQLEPVVRYDDSIQCRLDDRTAGAIGRTPCDGNLDLCHL